MVMCRSPVQSRSAAPHTYRILHCLESKQRALHATRADRDVEEGEDGFRREGIDLCEGFSDELVTQHRHRGLAYGAAFAGPGDVGEVVIFNQEGDCKFIAAADIFFFAYDAPLTPTLSQGEREFMVRVMVVIEDVFGVEIHVRGARRTRGVRRIRG